MKLNRGQIKLPEIVADVYRDLQDRRLLPVAVLLAIGIVAAPFLLASEDSSPVPEGGSTSAALLEATDPAPEAQPVVLTEVPGLRDFRQRLDAFRSKNPFRQQLTSPPRSVDQAQQDAEVTLEPSDSSSGGGGTDASSVEDTIASTSTSGSGSTSTSTSTTDEPVSTDGGTKDGSSGDGEVKVETKFFTLEIDVRIGPAGETKKKKGLRPGAFLPKLEKPLLQFISGDSEGSKAVFATTRNVFDKQGDGRCEPKKSQCDFLLLEEGQTATFMYRPEGRRYRLELRKVRVVEVDGEELAATVERPR